MKLKEKSFPLSFSLQETTDFIKDTIQQKNWENFELIEVKLVFVPYYFFSFEGFFEEEGKVLETVNGKTALNGMTSELEEISVPEENELTEEIKEIPSNIPFTELKFELTEKVEQIAQIKVAANLKTAKDNVIIHSMKKVLFPVWIIDFAVAEQTFQFKISGVDGEIVSEEEIPERQLGFWEITAETLNELQSPDAWVHYTTSIISDTTNFVAENVSGNVIENFMKNTRFQIFVLLIILILVVLWTYGII